MTSPVDTSVKYLHSAMIGAPVLSGTAGAFIAVLDACLVNGFGLKSVDSLVISNNVATASIASGHSAEVGSVIDMANATPSDLNGEQKVIAVTGNTVSFATTGLADQTATGAITLRIAALKWGKAFAGTNLAAYRPSDVTSNRNYLRVDDTSTAVARVVGYESMTDVNTGAGAFPTPAQVAGGGWWAKSNQANTTARAWILCGDSKGFYIFIAPTAGTPNSFQSFYFGELNAAKTNDLFSTCINCDLSDLTNTSTQGQGVHNSNGSTAINQYLARSFTGLGTSIQTSSYAPDLWGNTNYYSGSNSGGTPFPNSSDGGLYTAVKNVNEATSRCFRGTLPGLYLIPQEVGVGQFALRDSITGIGGLPGRTLRATLHYSSQGADRSISLIDTTGPWR